VKLGARNVTPGTMPNVTKSATIAPVRIEVAGRRVVAGSRLRAPASPKDPSHPRVVPCAVHGIRSREHLDYLPTSR